jgi:hypothetical protein
MTEELNKKKTMQRKIIIFLFMISIFVLALIPQIRTMIISFGETFIVHRALNAAAWNNLMVKSATLGIFLSLISFLICLSYKNIYRFSIEFINFIQTNDLISIIRQRIKQIPLLYKKSFIIIFIGVNFVFLFHTVSFIWGNHDWYYLVAPNRDSASQIALGRYFHDILLRVLLHGLTLPILTNVIGFFLCSLAAIFLCIYWQIPKRLSYFCIAGLLLLVQPFTLMFLYFQGIEAGVLSNFSLVLFVVLSCIITENIYSKKNKIPNILFGILSAWFALGSYPSVINTISVVFLGRILIDYTSQEYKSFYTIIKRHIWTAISLFSSCIVHLGVITIMKKKGLIISFYNTDTLDITEIPARLPEIAKVQINKLFYYDIGFPPMITIVFTILLVIGIGGILIQIIRSSFAVKIKLLKTGTTLFLIFAALFFSLSHELIAKFWFVAGRPDVFGLAIFHILGIVLVFRLRNNVLKNAGVVFCVILLQICVIHDLNIQKIWKFGFETEKMMWNRLLSRIELTPGFEEEKDYRVLVIGTLPSYRMQYVPKSLYSLNEKKTSWTADLFRYSFAASWGNLQLQPLRFYGIYPGFWKVVAASGDILGDPLEIEQLIKEMRAEIEASRAWPALASITIKDDILLIVLNQAELDRIKAGLNE